MEYLSCLDEKIIAHNVQLPRYTSYPSSPHFHKDISSSEIAAWYRQLDEESTISLYIHIPYCRNICWYCGCHAKATRRDEPLIEYVEALKQEIALIAAHIPAGCKVNHIHFGGGSPTLLTFEMFEALMASLHSYFNIKKDAEIAIEIDPRTVSEVKIAAYAQAGVNRVSLGVQDFNEKTQKAINRYQPFYLVYETLSLLKEYGITATHFDLIYGLPEQTLASMKETIKLTLSLKPQRIALFGYAHVPWMKKNMRLIDEASLPSATQRSQLLNLATEMLTAHGYMAVGIDHFVRMDDPMYMAAKEGRLHRNFQGYTTDTADALIGLGASAISSLPQGYLQNDTDIASYKDTLKQHQLAYKKGFKLEEDDVLRRYVIERLMCDFEIDLDHVIASYPQAKEALQENLNALQKLSSDGLVEINDRHIKINQDAKQIVRKVCSVFDMYYQEKPRQHAQML